MVTTATALVLAGCGSGAGATAAAPAAPATPAAPAGTSAALTTWTSPLGPIVVVPGGSAVYVFDRDAAGSGSSACTGTCAQRWPPVPAPAGTAQVSGVTGRVGALTRDDGSRQLTLDGRPLYTYAGDAPGQVTGQGVQGVWWVVDPSGHSVSRTAAAPSTADDGGGAGY
jgi:predicted lipoprotein with Yx(FWY)xxD motif